MHQPTNSTRHAHRAEGEVLHRIRVVSSLRCLVEWRDNPEKGHRLGLRTPVDSGAHPACSPCCASTDTTFCATICIFGMLETGKVLLTTVKVATRLARSRPAWTANR